MSGPGMVIIGAGHAGIRAALSMREFGYDGTVTLIAEEGATSPYERPPLSKWATGDGVPLKPMVPPDRLASANLSVVPTTVQSIDTKGRAVILSDERAIPYAKVLIAAGARARHFEPDVFPDTHVLYLRDRKDAETLNAAALSARKAVIIGGGFIGLELAASFRGLGLDVRVVEMADRLLSRAVSPPVAQIVQNLHTAHGVTFSFDAVLSPEQIEGHVTLSDGTRLPADLIVAGIGSDPNTELAARAGLAVENGIVTDAKLRTTVPDIYAAGDCCSFPLYGQTDRMVRLESWQTAGEQGALAGRNMVVTDPIPYTQVPWFWSDQYDHVLQVAGIPSAGCDIIERAYTEDQHVSFARTDCGTLSYACGIAPGTKVAKDIRFSAKMIEAGLKPDQVALANPGIALKSLLRG